MRYITIPQLVDAICFTGENHKEVEEFTGCDIKFDMMQQEILKLPNGGELILRLTDFVVKDIGTGEISTLRPREFRKKYRPAQAHEV